MDKNANMEFEVALIKTIKRMEDALTKIALSEYSDVSGNPSKWASTIAYLGLGGKFVNGNRLNNVWELRGNWMPPEQSELSRPLTDSRIKKNWNACRAQQSVGTLSSTGEWKCQTCGADNLMPECRYVDPNDYVGKVRL